MKKSNKLQNKFSNRFRIFVAISITIILIWRVISGGFFEEFAKNKIIFQLIFAFITYMVIGMGFYIGVKKLKFSRLSELDKEQSQQTKECYLALVGLAIIVFMIFFTNNLISNLNGIVGLLIILYAIYLQYKKPRGNEYVVKNIWYCTSLLIIGLFIFLLINYYSFRV